jgi:hypothetical protein
MDANWLAHQVTPLKKQVHPGWEYSELQDPTQETFDKIRLGRPPTSRRDVLEYQQLALTQSSAHLPSSNGKGPGKATLLWLINFLLIIYFLHMFL